jgi:uncharacterized protein (DUF2225 family)
LINAIDNKYCSKCSYPLVPSAFDEIKEAENRKLQEMEQSNVEKEKLVSYVRTAGFNNYTRWMMI